MRYRVAQTLFVLALSMVAVSAMAGFRFRSPFPFFPDHIQLVLGGDKADPAAAFNPDSTNEQLLLGVGGGAAEVGRQLIITDVENIAKDHNTFTAPNPRLYVFSATDPTPTGSEHVSVYHDQTDGFFTTGTGNVVLQSATSLAVVPPGVPFSSFSPMGGAKYVTLTGAAVGGAPIDADLDLSAGTATQFYVFDPSVDRTITLPVNHRPGQMITVVNQATGGFPTAQVYFDSAADTINTSTSATVFSANGNNGSSTVISDGDNWYVLGMGGGM